ncbi:uncharacterized protein LOC134568881 [Pelobates fuscus]|uniref:uncharacterized protein LOC134568881 n=1 Tax=Pelobates fuscus TaxID=191477 RepID=UPI002FE4339E
MDNLDIPSVNMENQSGEDNNCTDEYYPIDLMTCQEPQMELTEDKRDSDVNPDLPQISNALDRPLEISVEEMMTENLSLDGTSLTNILRWPPEWVENLPDNNYTTAKETKMCNEETATYWTGGGGDSCKQDNILTPSILESEQADDNMSLAKNNPRLYFPLEKTLRNLQLLDLKLQYNTRQAAGNKNDSECNNDSSSSSDESESKSVESSEQQTNHEETERAQNLALITLLSQCHLKLQHLEELKHYAGHLAHSLWEAQETISYLKENVAALHRENVQKENKISNLSKELMESKRLLYEKSERISDMKAMFKSLGDHLQNRSTQQMIISDHCVGSSKYTGAGPVEIEPELSGLGNSKICTIL